MIKRLQAIRKRGFNLIESAIVLGLVGAVLGGIWSAASSVIENHKVNKTVEMMQQVTQELSSLIKPFVGGYADGATEIYATIPSGMPADFEDKDGMHFVHPWGGGLSVFIQKGATFPPLIHFRFDNLHDDAACTQLIMRTANFFRDRNSLFWIYVENIQTLTSFPVSLEQARALCEDPNRSTYSYRLRIAFTL